MSLQPNWAVAETPYASPDQLESQQWRALGKDTGEAKYLLVAETFAAIEAQFKIFDAIPQPIFTEIWDVLRRGLPRIRDADTSGVGAQRAEAMLGEVLGLLQSDARGR